MRAAVAGFIARPQKRDLATTRNNARAAATSSAPRQPVLSAPRNGSETLRTALATNHAAATTWRPAATAAQPQLLVAPEATEPVIPEALAFLSDEERSALDLVLQRSESRLRRVVRRQVMREVLALDEVPPPRPPASNDADPGDWESDAGPPTLWYQRALLAWETEGVDPTGRGDERVAARLGRRLSGAVVLALHIGLFADRAGGAWVGTLARKHGRAAAVLRRARDGDARAVLIARLASQAARDRILGHIRDLDHELRLQARRDLACFERAVGRRFEGAEARATLLAIAAVQRWLHLRAGAGRAPFCGMLREFIPAASRACVEAALA